jgi:splicing factor 3B subunit 3
LFHLNGFLLQETSLELVAVGDDGVLQSICEQDMFGIVKDIGVLQWHSRHVGLIPQVLYFFLSHQTIMFDIILFHTPLSLIGLKSEGLINSRIFQIEDKDLLVVLSDSGKLSLLYFCPEMHRLVPFTSVYLCHFPIFWLVLDSSSMLLFDGDA